LSVDELITKLQDLVPQMEFVRHGDYVFAKHPNAYVDYCTYALDVCKQLYERYKAKTGKTLPEVEYWLSMAESRIGLTRKVKFGDLVLTKDHNLLIDSLKPLELALRKMEQS